MCDLYASVRQKQQPLDAFGTRKRLFICILVALWFASQMNERVRETRIVHSYNRKRERRYWKSLSRPLLSRIQLSI